MDYADRIAISRDRLLRMERVSRDELRGETDARLRDLLSHARRSTRFYESRLPPLGSTIPAEDWRAIPLVRRVDIQDRLAALTARALPPFSGRAVAGRTSGSSGRALDYLGDEGLDLVNAAQTDRVFAIWQFDGRKSLATFLSMYDDPTKREIRRYGWRIGEPDGVREILEVSNDIGTQLDWLKATRPDYLYARGGTHLEELARLALSRGDALRFAKILSNGSPLSPSAIASAKKAFRAQVIDLYGASETGLIGYTCPDCRQMHTCDETMIVEVLRDDGSDCEPGEIGRVVVTPLHGYAMPLIRYEIGDYAVRGPRRARCGRPFGSLAAIRGRYRGSFVLRDGRIVHPYANATRIGEHLAYRQIQLVQTDFERVELRYVPAESAKETDQDAIVALFRQFMPDVAIDFVPVQAFPLDRNGKFEETLSLVPRPS